MKKKQQPFFSSLFSNSFFFLHFRELSKSISFFFSNTFKWWQRANMQNASYKKSAKAIQYDVIGFKQCNNNKKCWLFVGNVDNFTLFFCSSNDAEIPMLVLFCALKQGDLQQDQIRYSYLWWICKGNKGLRFLISVYVKTICKVRLISALAGNYINFTTEKSSINQ